MPALGRARCAEPGCAHVLQHVAMADEAYCIGPAAARESYLRGDSILLVGWRWGFNGPVVRTRA